MNARIPGYYNGVAADRNSAISILNNMTDWSDGWLYSIKYIANASGVLNSVDDVGVILALGIKNSAECGAGGNADPNLFFDRSMDHGPQFYKIVGESTNTSYPTSVGGPGDFDTTTMTLNTTSFDVVNANGEDEVIEDPFVIEFIPR